ncbi:hypothetical protein M9H77_03962 [Catharanthus roseus]|uniref:Uncharacterized protein n=1 Tax=Catharanthus roseus TaxID=4058 RepID=A0ACC0CCX2_CATRO|nr:hypothetical protein M9H77_03962 [Catharanthus roseus]
MSNEKSCTKSSRRGDLTISPVDQAAQPQKWRSIPRPGGPGRSRSKGCFDNNLSTSKASKGLEEVVKSISPHSAKRNLKKWEQKWRKKREKAKINSDFKNLGGVLEHFWGYGWESLVTMTRDYYPNLFREFYANIFFKSDRYKIDITTSVKIVQIYLDRAILVQILGIPNKGHSVFYERASTNIFADPNWVYSKALARFGVQAQM